MSDCRPQRPVAAMVVGALVLCLSSIAIAQQALTAGNPAVAVEDLDVALTPLSVDELGVEASAWFSLTQDATRQVAELELAIQRAERGDGEQTAGNEELFNAEKNQSAVLERFGVVLDELEAKGGDVESYRAYVASISGIDVRDTSRLGARAWFWLTSPDGGLRWIINAVKFVIVLWITIVVFRFLADKLALILDKTGKSGGLIQQFAVTSMRRGGVVIGVLLGLAAMGVSLGPIFAVVGAVSFVLAFALQSNLANLASGLMLMVNRPFEIGDEVKIGGHWAYVDSISLSNTVLKNFDGSILTLPNNSVWGGEIVNFTHDDTRKIVIPIRIRFSEDISRITEIWNDLAASIPTILKDPAPGIFAYAGSAIDYSVPVSLMAWAKTDEFWDAYTEALKGLQVRAEQDRIELAPPQQEIHLAGQGLPAAP